MTIIEIENQILTEKNARTELADINSVSQTAEFRLWVKIFATMQFFLQNLWEIFKTEITEIIAKRRIGTPSWYIEIAKDFQLGDTLQENGTYLVIDATKKIITRAAFRETGGLLTIKVAKGTALLPVALSPAELTQFTAYIDKSKFAGTKTNIISLNADILAITATIYYDAIYDIAETKTLIGNAIVAYLQNLSFDALFVKNELIQKIRSVRGIKDCVIDTLTANGNPIGRTYDSLAGYIKYTPNPANFTLI